MHVSVLHQKIQFKDMQKREKETVERNKLLIVRVQMKA